MNSYNRNLTFSAVANSESILMVNRWQFLIVQTVDHSDLLQIPGFEFSERGSMPQVLVSTQTSQHAEMI